MRDAGLSRGAWRLARAFWYNGGMKNLAIGLLGLSALVAGCASEETVYVDNMPAAAKQALQTAVAHAGFASPADVRIKKVELDRDHASSVYEVEFEKGWYEYEYDIDAATGKILKSKKEFDW